MTDLPPPKNCTIVSEKSLIRCTARKGLSERHTVDQIVAKLHKADVELGKGKTATKNWKLLEVVTKSPGKTYYRWRQKYGGTKPELAKQLKALEKENARLNKMVAEQALDIEILKQAAKGN